MEKLNGNKKWRKSSLFNICPCEPKMVLENQRPFFIYRAFQSIRLYRLTPLILYYNQQIILTRNLFTQFLSFHISLILSFVYHTQKNVNIINDFIYFSFA